MKKYQKWVLYGALLILCAPGQDTFAQSSEKKRFSSPRKTVITFFEWQKSEQLDDSVAAEAFEIDSTLSQQDRILLAKQLRAILDNRGLFINLDRISDNPDYADSLTGLQEVILHPKLPQIYLTKKGTRWLFSRESVFSIPYLYRQTVSAAVDYIIDRLPAFFKKQILAVKIWQVIGVFIFVFLGFFVRKLTEFSLEILNRKFAKKTKTEWDEKFMEICKRPLSLLLMAGWFMISYTNLQLSVTVNAVIRVFCEALFYFSTLWLLYRLIDLLEVYLSAITAKTASKLDDQLVPLVRKSLRVFIVVVGSIFVLQNFDVNVTSLLTGLGLGGLAFALAARDTLANFFGSITIFLDKPFQVGDWIIFKNVEGTVEEVGFRSTRLRTFYNSVVSVPNAKVADSAIDNMGLRTYRRIKTTIGLHYKTTPIQMQAFVEGLRSIIKANQFTRKDYYEIHFNDFGAYSLDVLFYVFVRVENWSAELRERHNIMLEVLRLADELGVEFAFPTQTLNIDSFYKDTPREVGKPGDEMKLAATAKAFGPKGELSQPEGPKLP